MIFVTVGSDRFQFNRLVRAVDEYCGREKQSACIQLGSSDYRPRYCQWFEFMPFEEIRLMIVRSSIVIAHAGAGTVLTCINNGKIPLVMPRLSQYGEAVDDHQVEFAYHMQEHGYARVVDPENLSDSLRRCRDHAFEYNASKKLELVEHLSTVTRYGQHHRRTGL